MVVTVTSHLAIKVPTGRRQEPNQSASASLVLLVLIATRFMLALVPHALFVLEALPVRTARKALLIVLQSLENTMTTAFSRLVQLGRLAQLRMRPLATHVLLARLVLLVREARLP